SPWEGAGGRTFLGETYFGYLRVLWLAKSNSPSLGGGRGEDFFGRNLFWVPPSSMVSKIQLPLLGRGPGGGLFWENPILGTSEFYGLQIPTPPPWWGVGGLAFLEVACV